MFGSALYFPYIDIHDPKWLRSAALFWDEIRTIAPRSVGNPYRGSDTKILWKEGFLEPLRCDLHPDLLNNLGKKAVSLIDRNQFRISKSLFERPIYDLNESALFHADEAGARIYDHFERANIHPEKMSLEMRHLLMRSGLARMHPEKLSSEVRRLIYSSDRPGMSLERSIDLGRYRHGYLQGDDEFEGEWLIIDSKFADIYMSALATLLSKEANLAALTNEERSLGVGLHTLIEDVKPSGQSDKKGALVSFVMEAISIDPKTRIDKLLNFKRKRTNQLADLSACFDEISSKISSCDNAKELEEGVRYTYTTKVRPKLESLKNELKDSSIQAVWEGVQRAVTISVPSAGATAYFTGLTGTTLLAAGAAIAVADVAVKTHLAGKKTRRASPYTYLLDVERKFSSGT